MVHNTLWWKILLALKEKASEIQENVDLFFLDDQGCVHITKDSSNIKALLGISFNDDQYEVHNNTKVPVFRVYQNLKCELINNSCLLSLADQNFLQLYLPYALMPTFAKKLRKTYAVSHLTQSLDGKIATNSGHSKWIGNNEDLIHTHCMRSLCDAIIIGNNTLKNDEPKLTVRRVEGKSPVKMIIGNTKSNLESLLADTEYSLVSFSNKKLYEDNHRVKEVIIAGNSITSTDILTHLYEAGFYSVFIEGGAQTVSCFLKEKALDSLQIHIANKILGSGISAVKLDEISTIDQSISLVNTRHYQLGEEILLVANL